MNCIKYIVLALLFLCGCDDMDFRKLESGSNSPPVIYFNGNSSTTTFSDSLKMGSSIKFTVQPYAFVLNVADKENKLNGVSVSIVGGDGVLSNEGRQLTGPIALGASGDLSLTFLPAQKNATYNLTFIVTDSFFATAQASFKLVTFDNLPPVAALSVSKDNKLGPYSLSIDGSKSYDRDRRFGGSIAYYEFSITDGTGIHPLPPTLSPTMVWEFEGPGSYTVTLNVFDNDGAKTSASSTVQF